MQKSFYLMGLTLMLLVGLFAGAIFHGNSVAVAAETTDAVKNAISVQGNASVTVTPTIAYVNIGVTTFNKVASVAQTDNAKKMDQVYQALAALGIPKDKIKTVSYYISPRYNYGESASTLAGYDVSNTILVTVTDLTKVSRVLDMTVQQGINQANSISFDITDQEREKIYLQALTQAVASAKVKASTLAAAAGVIIDKPAQIIEGSAGYMPQPVYGMGDMVKAESAVATPVSPGEMKVQASVTVIYNY